MSNDAETMQPTIEKKIRNKGIGKNTDHLNYKSWNSENII